MRSFPARIPTGEQSAYDPPPSGDHKERKRIKELTFFIVYTQVDLAWLLLLRGLMITPEICDRLWTLKHRISTWAELPIWHGNLWAELSLEFLCHEYRILGV